jgi:hypothetical protein
MFLVSIGSFLVKTAGFGGLRIFVPDLFLKH